MQIDDVLNNANLSEAERASLLQNCLNDDSLPLQMRDYLRHNYGHLVAAPAVPVSSPSESERRAMYDAINYKAPAPALSFWRSSWARFKLSRVGSLLFVQPVNYESTDEQASEAQETAYNEAAHFRASLLVAAVVVALFVWAYHDSGTGGFWGLFSLLFLGFVAFGIYKLLASLIASLNEQHSPAVDELPQRGKGPYGEGGFAYFWEISCPQYEMTPYLKTDWQKAIFLQTFVEVYNVPAPEINFKLGYMGNIHGVTLAPSGSGKGTAAILPTLLSNEESVFVLDVKGENYFVTHRTRELCGHTCHVLNPWNLWGADLGYKLPFTSRYNPLHKLRADNPDFVKHIRALAAALIVEQGKEPHFTNRARDLVACLMAHVCTDENELKAGNNHLPRVRQILGLPIEALCDYMLTASLNPVPLVRDNAATFSPAKPSEARELQSIVSTALGQLGFLSDPALAHFLTGCDFDFSLLRQPKTSVFFMIPPEHLQGNKPFARLMVQSLLNAIWKQPKGGEASVLVVLDEQYQLGSLDDLKTAPALLRSYRARLWSIFQNIGQLKDLYGDAWEGVLANAGFVQVFTPNDLETAEYFSRRIGKTTTLIDAFSGGTSASSSHSGGGSSGSSSGWSRSPAAVDAVSPQALMGWPRDKALLFAHGLPFPAITTRTPYFQIEDLDKTKYMKNPTLPEFYDEAIAEGRQWHAARIEQQKAQAVKAGGVVLCIHCGQKLRVPVNRGAGRATCPKCGGQTDVLPSIH